MALVEELVETLQLFAQGQWLLWQQLAGDYGLLRRGLREAVDNQATVALQGCWDALKHHDVPRVIAHYYYRQSRGVDSDRLARDARALVATALVAAWARQSPPSRESVEQAERWARQAAELLGGTVGGGMPGSLSASLSWTTGIEPAELIEKIYAHLAGEGYQVSGARHWSLYWVGASRAPRRLRVPVACVVRGQGHLGDLYLELLAAGPDVLIEDPEMALWPVGGSFLETLEQARQGVNGAFSWRFAFRQPQSVGQVPLVGDSAGGAAAVGFRLLAQGQPYDAGCLIVAGVAQGGTLRAVGGEREKLAAAVNGGIRRAVVAPETALAEADRDSLRERGLAIEKRSTVDDACRFASDLPQQLIGYFRLLEEAPDGEAPPYLGGRKPSELYVAPDVLVRVKRVREEPPGPGGRETVSEPRGVSRLPETALEVGEVYPYGFRVEEADERLSWQRVRQRMEGVQRAVVVLGPPGQGKTQLVRMTARELAREAREALEEQREAFDQVPLPVVVRCQALAEAQIPANVSAENELRARIQGLLRAAGASEEAAQYIAGHCDQARCWLFLDALDEVAEPERLEAFWGVLRQWQTRVVLTSRPYAYQGGLPFQPLECRLAPFVARQTRALVERWYAEDSGRAAPLLQTLRSSAGLEQMGQNPLLLTLVCWLAEDREITPDLSRSQLYEWMVRDLLSLDRNGSLDPVRRRGAQLLPLVREIGWRWFEANQGKKALPHDQLRDWIENSNRRPPVKGPAHDLSAAEKAERIIEELCSEKRFLTLFEWNRQPAYVFPHRSILEFLAGAELAEKLKGDSARRWWDFVDRMAWDPGWEGVLLFAAGQLGERANDLARRLLDGEDDIFRHRLALAAMCLAEAPLHVRLEELVDRITAEVWHFQSSEVRDPAWVLARETLDKLHHAGSAWVAAGKLNGKVTEAKLLELLVQQVKQGEERAIWLAGRLGIAATQSPDLVASLLQMLRSNSRRWVAAEALKNLGAHVAGHPATITALAEALERYGHRDYFVRTRVTEALSKLGGPAASHPDVRRALSNGLRSHDPAKRALAAEVIGRLGDAVATDDDLMSALLSAFRDDDLWVHFSATTALAELGDACLRFPGTMPSLLNALKSDDAKARRNAAIVLSALHEVGSWKSQVTEALLDALRREDHAGPTAISLGRALLAVGGEEAVGQHLIPMILRYLQAQGRWHLTAAADLVAEMAEVVARNDQVIAALLPLHRHADSHVRSAVTSALGKCAVVRFEDARLVAGLRAAMKDRAPRVRATALDRLGELIESFGPARVLQDEDLALIKKVLLEERSERVRSSAIRLVGKLGELVARDHRVIEALLDGLRSWKWPLWEVPAEALTELGPSAATSVKVLDTVATLFRQHRAVAMHVLVAWDNQGLRIFRQGDSFRVRTIAELTQPSRT